MRFSPAAALVIAILSGAVGMVGVFLDTAWHRTIGRDSFLILPHAFIYVGGLGIWLVAVSAVAHASLGGAADFGGARLRVGRAVLPFGFALAALGVLLVGLAAPVDIWWHWMYGKDTLIWAPGHLMGHFGAAVTALGLGFAIAGQAGRGGFRRPALWRLAMLLVFTDLLHRALFVLAHYTMIPESRTPAFYPFLLGLLVPLVLVAAWRALGPSAPVTVAAMFLGVATLADALLWLIDFDRYTLTPLVVVPAGLLTPLLRLDPGGRRSWLAAAYGVAFTLVTTSMETLWMAQVTARPWPLDRVVAGLPRSLVAAALSAWVGWVVGGFLRAAAIPGGVDAVFGHRRRARWLAAGALALAGIGLASTHHPQRFGPPMTVAEWRFRPIASLRYQEAMFWNVVLEDRWWRAPRLTARNEGIIDGVPVLPGPAWCAPTREALEADLPDVRFALAVNGTPVDLAGYPLVRLTMRGGEHCAWVGVASDTLRASENRFVYRVSYAGRVRQAAGTDHTVIEMEVVLKDP